MTVNVFSHVRMLTNNKSLYIRRYQLIGTVQCEYQQVVNTRGVYNKRCTTFFQGCQGSVRVNSACVVEQYKVFAGWRIS